LRLGLLRGRRAATAPRDEADDQREAHACDGQVQQQLPGRTGRLAFVVFVEVVEMLCVGDRLASLVTLLEELGFKGVEMAPRAGLRCRCLLRGRNGTVRVSIHRILSFVRYEESLGPSRQMNEGENVDFSASVHF
jgi:hypothetical protein